MMKHRTIRSTAQRQILTWLRHGPSTVSEIAEQFSMRMPHASLACRQLREAGLITRDELWVHSIYLSQGGMDCLWRMPLVKCNNMLPYFGPQRSHVSRGREQRASCLHRTARIFLCLHR